MEEVITMQLCKYTAKSPKVLYRVIDGEGRDFYFRTEKQARDFIMNTKKECGYILDDYDAYHIRKLVFEYNLYSIMALCDYVNGN